MRLCVLHPGHNISTGSGSSVAVRAIVKNIGSTGMPRRLLRPWTRLLRLCCGLEKVLAPLPAQRRLALAPRQRLGCGFTASAAPLSGPPRSCAAAEEVSRLRHDCDVAAGAAAHYRANAAAEAHHRRGFPGQSRAALPRASAAAEARH